MSNKPHVIVVGIDYSPQSERALFEGFEQARKHAPAALHVVHVAPPIPDGEAAFLKTGPLSLNELKDQLVTYLRAFVLKLDATAAAHVRVISHVVVDAPMLGLTSLAVALEADLIVVGTHGRSGLARWLLGSVAEGVVRHSSCPVLVVPPERELLKAPTIEAPCSRCVEERKATGGLELWCAQHRERHGQRHTYHQSDRAAAPTNMPLVVR